MAGRIEDAQPRNPAPPPPAPEPAPPIATAEPPAPVVPPREPSPAELQSSEAARNFGIGGLVNTAA